MKALAGFVVLLATAGSAAAQTDCGELPKNWEGQVYAVSGDTLGGAGLKPRIRLWGIRAPEVAPDPSMPAMRARAALADMLMSGGNRISCRMTGWDRECRAVAQCTITAEWPAGSKAQPHDLALRLVEDGFAWSVGLEAPPAWDKDAGEKMAHFEALSRQARKGLWLDWLGERAK
jgi:endonuclease YncB( thermonuclease family)